MGARQSSPGGSNGGSSLLPTSSSNNNSPRAHGSNSDSSNRQSNDGYSSPNSLYHNGSSSSRSNRHSAIGGGGGSGGSSDWRQRARSLTNVISSNPHSSNGQPIVTVSPLGHPYGLSVSPDSFNSIDDLTNFGRVFSAHSLPVQLVPFNLKCPVCSKTILPDDVECHLVMCLTKPRINYNEDILTEDKGECVICLDDLSKGNKIARLPCLCIYHKVCIDAWFEVNRSCPEHPSD